MLVLTINAPDKLHIGDEITIQFLPNPDNEIVKLKRVQVAIDAPKEILVLRNELVKP